MDISYPSNSNSPEARRKNTDSRTTALVRLESSSLLLSPPSSLRVPEGLLQRMPYTDDETSSRFLKSRLRSLRPENKFLRNAGLESLSQCIGFVYLALWAWTISLIPGIGHLHSLWRLCNDGIRKPHLRLGRHTLYQ